MALEDCAPAPPREIYRRLATVHAGAVCSVHRGRRERDGRAVVLKTCRAGAAGDPRREREILDRLDSPRVERCLDLVEEDDGSLTLVLEDAGGDSLDRILASRPIGVAEFMDIAVEAAAALADLHRAGVVHGRIDPAHLLWDGRTESLKVIDLAAAEAPWVALPARMPAPTGPRLAYLAPEQTGRMPRGVGHRSDLYSLGATLYALLVRRPPFDPEDALEGQHALLARVPAAPSVADATVPEALSRIVMRLLEKLPEQRYRSARGLLEDLAACREHYRRHGALPRDFEPARLDVADRFHLSGRLYGRGDAIARLEAALGRAREAAGGIVAVEGVSGIGKTALLLDTAHRAAATGALAGYGKFDQFAQVPYAGLTAALRQVIAEALAQAGPVAARIRERCRDALGPNAAVIVNLVPEAARLLGRQPPPPPLSAQSTRNRLHRSVARLLHGLASREHPVALLLDDLQWADAASLALVLHVAGEPGLRGVAVAGAYRSEEVGLGHPLRALLARLRDDEAAGLVELSLAPLGPEDVAALLAESLGVAADDVADLAAEVARLGSGNAFLVHRILADLHETGRLDFDPDGRRWRWDLDAVREAGRRGSVAEVLARSLRALPRPTRDALAAASLLGPRFAPATLAVALERDPDRLRADLRPALAARLLATVAGGAGGTDAGGPLLAFVHDRVQQAAYELIRPGRHEELHLEIGRRLRAGRPFAELGEEAFAIVEHINRGARLVGGITERLDLARLDLAAGRRAKAASAHSAAHRCLRVALELLPASIWTLDPALGRAVHRELAEVEFLLGDPDRALALVREALEHTPDPESRAVLDEILIVAQTLSGDYAEALRVGRESLAALGVELPAGDVAGALERDLRPLLEIGPADVEVLAPPGAPAPEGRVRAALRLLMQLLPPSYFVEPDLNSWVALEMVELSRRHGFAPESVKGLVNLANVLALRGEYERAHALGELAASLAERLDAPDLRPRVLYTRVTYLQHWLRPLADSVALGDEAFRACLDAGDLQYAGYVLAFHKTLNEIFLGEPLATVRGRLHEYLRFTARTHNELATNVLLAADAVVANLLGETAGPDSFDTERIGEAALVERCERHGHHMALCVLHLLQANARMLDGRWEEALASVREARRRISFVSSTLPVAMATFAEAMCLAAGRPSGACAPAGPPGVRLARLGDALERWAALCPENFAGPSLLVQAERARLEGRRFEALDLYDRAARERRPVGFVPVAALAEVRAARLWSDLGKTEFAHLHLQRAFGRFEAWGAHRVHGHLVREFGYFPGGAPSPSVPARGPSADVDLAAVVKASRAISAELRLDRLLATLVTVLAEAAGARRAVLALAEAGGLTVEAVLEPDGVAPVVLQSTPIAEAGGFARAVVERVAETGDLVLVDDAREHPVHGADPHVRAEGVRSLLCLPILVQRRVVGVVYLENALAPGIFDADRVEVVRLLAAQAAIGIHNALLFRTLEEKVAERTADLEAARRAAEEARMAAEAANRAKSEFLANMSHELRTPLNAVIGFSDVLRERLFGPLNDKQAEYVDDIAASGEHLLSLINDLLDLSRIEAGRMDLRREPFDVAEAVQAALGLVRERAREGGVALASEGDAGAEIALGDPRRTKQILVNLLANAVRFTPSGGAVSVRAGRDGGRVRIEVSDTGVGIAPEHLERIFEPFYQVEDHGGTRKGTGLGLALSRTLAELQGGTLAAASVPGEGSTFTLSLEAAP